MDCSSYHGWLSAVHSDEDVARTLATYDKALGAMVAEGVFKGM